MPRSNRRRREQRGLSIERIAPSQRRENHPDGAWIVRRVRGRDDGRSYLCPGCQQTFTSALAHVVVWPAEGLAGLEDRRHWHTPCWQARGRRPPLGAYR